MFFCLQYGVAIIPSVLDDTECDSMVSCMWELDAIIVIQ